VVSFKRILCPVDLSPNSTGAIELASSLSQQYGATLVFIYVAPQWLPTETIADADYIRTALEYDQKAFEKMRPSIDGVACDHIFQQGNPGPAIVEAAADCDLIVMTTHGHTGFLRLLMGSVAEYVMRHVECPVLTTKIVHQKSDQDKWSQEKPTEAKSEFATTGAGAEPTAQPAPSPSPSVADQANPAPQSFVTSVMSHVKPIHEFDPMEDVIRDLNQAEENAAPVVDEQGACSGILTRTDINHYGELKQRLEARDETVIDEVYETDEFGQRRTGSCNFDQVCRHMTGGVITIASSETCDAAKKLLSENPRIHHLVVVDHADHPVGILDSRSDSFA
jgi:nucleotide-binding universal stress UspA family protein/CBS domain-containing protein